MKKNFMLVCIALILAMTLIVSCDNSNKNPDAGKFTVTFDTDGGGAIDPVKVGLWQTVAEPAKPIKYGYIFIEWQLDGKKYDFKTPVTKDITLKAIWEFNGVEVSDEAGFKSALEDGKNIMLLNDVNITDTISISKSSLINLSEKTLTINRIDIKSLGDITTEVVFVNGKIKCTNSTGGVTRSTIVAYEKTKLVLDGINFSTTKSGLLAANNNDNITIEVLNSKLTASCFGVGTNATIPNPSSNIKFIIKNSEIITESDNGDNTGILFNVMGSVQIEDSTITSGRQAVILRGGEGHKITNSTLNATGNNNVTAEYTSGYWESGNEVPLAALVIGNRTSSAYEYKTSVTLDNVTLKLPEASKNSAGKKYTALYVYQNDTTNTVSVLGTLSSTSENSVNDEKHDATYKVTGGKTV